MIYNFISNHVCRRNRGFLIVYKGVNLVFEKGANLIVEGGVCFVGSESPFASRASTIVCLNANSEMIMHSRAVINYGVNIVVKPKARFEIGQGSFLNYNCIIRCHYNISFGEECITGTEVDIRDIYDHSINGIRQIKETIIGKHVWLGARSMVLGARIGDGCIIGACALVTKDIPNNSIAYGVPALVHRENIDWSY